MINGIAKTPPAGIGHRHPKITAKPPEIALPAVHAATIRSGSLARNGKTPSVINHKPSGSAVFAASCSAFVNRFLAKNTAMATPTGGVIPLTMLAAFGA